VSKDFFNARAATWDEKVAEKDVSRLETILTRMKITPGDAVLDVGTGTGVFVPFLLKKIGNKGRLVCLDFAEGMLDVARRKNFNGNVEFICANIENSGLPDSSFDAVVCYSVFPHFEDKARALREICRVLQPGGRIFIAHTSSRQEINDIHRGLPEVCGHVFPENEEMQRLLSEAGFTDITISESQEHYFASARKPI
jgi:ubiquinone/menaquinone biosynthesis C-methylase UbiE